MYIFFIGLFYVVAAQNASSVIDAGLPNSTRMMLGEGAIGGLIPTSVVIVLIAILRILQMYKAAQQRPPTATTAPEDQAASAINRQEADLFRLKRNRDVSNNSEDVNKSTRQE